MWPLTIVRGRLYTAMGTRLRLAVAHPAGHLLDVPGLDLDRFMPAPLDDKLLRTARQPSVAKSLCLDQSFPVTGYLDRPKALVRFLLPSEKIDPCRPIGDAFYVNAYAVVHVFAFTKQVIAGLWRHHHVRILTKNPLILLACAGCKIEIILRGDRRLKSPFCVHVMFVFDPRDHTVVCLTDRD